MGQANLRDQILIEDPKTLDERQQVAREFAAQFKVSLPIVVDNIDDQVDKAYAGMPDRIYVIDAQGQVAYKSAPGPRGFIVAEASPVLDKLLGVSLASKASVAEQRPVRPGGSGTPGGGDLRERMVGLLQRLGLEEKAIQQVSQALDRKVEAYRGVIDARHALLQTIREQGDTAQALTALEEAHKKYGQAIAQIDQDLDSALGYSAKPKLHATLTALGLIGTAPAPPFTSLPMGPLGRPGELGGAGGAGKPEAKPRPQER